MNFHAFSNLKSENDETLELDNRIMILNDLMVSQKIITDFELKYKEDSSEEINQDHHSCEKAVTEEINEFTDFMNLHPNVCKLFVNPDKFSVTYFNDFTGFFKAICFSVFREFILKDESEQNEFITKMKTEMIDQIERYYDEYEYRKYGYLKTVISKILWQNENRFHKSIFHYVSNFIGHNILIIEASSYPYENVQSFCGSYSWAAPYDETKPCIVLHRMQNRWGSFISANFKSHFDINQEYLNGFLVPKTPVEPEVQFLTTEEKENVMRKLKELKIYDLREQCFMTEIPIEQNGKKKLKKQLIEELYEALTGDAV